MRDPRDLLVWSLLSVCAKMFLKIAECREEFCAMAAVKGFAVVKSKMSSQAISSVERLLATTLFALVRLNL